MSVPTVSKCKVSVIVAAYNQELFIGRCLRSLLHQTMSHNNYEIIVVDGLSEDGTKDEILKKKIFFTFHY